MVNHEEWSVLRGCRSVQGHFLVSDSTLDYLSPEHVSDNEHACGYSATPVGGTD